MSQFDVVFDSIAESNAVRHFFEVLNGYSPVFYSRAGGLYEMDKARSAIDAFAIHCSKLKLNVLGGQKGRLERNLQFKMNWWQTTSQFLRRCATLYEAENTVFLVPVLDVRGKTIGAFPVTPRRVEIVQSEAGELFLRYEFSNGKHAAVEYDRCGILVNRQYKSDFFGATNAALNPTLDLLDMQNQGIQNGIKSAAAIRFIAMVSKVLDPESLKKEQERFRTLNLSADNNGGVLIADNKYSEVKQIDSKPFVVDADQMKVINENIYEYFGTNEKILRNEWDEQIWAAYYEGRVEPFALQLSIVLSLMFFSEREIALGSEIMLSSNRMQFASIDAKISYITNLFDRGMLSQDEGREVVQMPPLPNGAGQHYFIRGEYVPTDEKTKVTETGGNDYAGT